MSLEQAPAREEASKIDWDEIFRQSFIFSQGSYGLQGYIFSWLAAGPLHEQKLADMGSAMNKTARYTKAIVEKKAHTAAPGIGGMVAKMSEELRSKIDYFSLFEEKDLKIQRRELVESIGRMTIEKDEHYLGKKTGRPITSDKRDRFSSFIIDFGILKRGDGLFTWKSMPEPYRVLWEEIIEYVRTTTRDKDRKRIAVIRDRYFEEHPNISIEEKEQILEVLGKE